MGFLDVAKVSQPPLHADKIDEAVMNMYPRDGILPGLEERIIQDHELDP